MEDHTHDEIETLSFSDLQIKDDNIDSEEVSGVNQNSSSTSSPSSFDQEFLGFFSEEWSRDHPNNTSLDDVIFCGKIVSSSNPNVTRNRIPEINSQTNPLFRSTSDSLRFMKYDINQSTPRSKSLPNRLPSSSSLNKSKWQKVLMFGFGSGKFPTRMDMSDIKNRQLRRQTSGTTTFSQRKSGKKGWWRLVDVLGCSGGYEIREIMVSFDP